MKSDNSERRIKQLEEDNRKLKNMVNNLNKQVEILKRHINSLQSDNMNVSMEMNNLKNMIRRYGN